MRYLPCRAHTSCYTPYIVCVQVSIYIYMWKYLGWLINTGKETDNSPEAFSLLRLVLFLADLPHWSENRRKMSPFNRDFIQDVTGSGAVTTLLGAAVKPAAVCKRRPGDGILRQSLPQPSVVLYISYKIVFKHGIEICVITSGLLWVRHLLDMSE